MSSDSVHQAAPGGEVPVGVHSGDAPANAPRAEGSARMNPEIKALWVAALRSGEFAQGKDELRDEANQFCCLGVLCELHNREVGGEWRIASANQVSLYMGEPGSLPKEVQQWAGVPDHNPRVSIQGVDAPLACHNDGREEAGTVRTFAEIADAIEEQL